MQQRNLYCSGLWRDVKLGIQSKCEACATTGDHCNQTITPAGIPIQPSHSSLRFMCTSQCLVPRIPEQHLGQMRGVFEVVAGMLLSPQTRRFASAGTNMDKIAGKTGPCRTPIQQTSNTWKNIIVDRLKGPDREETTTRNRRALAFYQSGGE